MCRNGPGCDEVDTLVDTKVDVSDIFLRHSRQIHYNTRQIDTLVLSELQYTRMNAC